MNHMPAALVGPSTFLLTFVGVAALPVVIETECPQLILVVVFQGNDRDMIAACCNLTNDKTRDWTHGQFGYRHQRPVEREKPYLLAIPTYGKPSTALIILHFHAVFIYIRQEDMQIL